jgi:hypothetical protein
MPTPTIPRTLALAAPMLAACILRPVPGDSTSSTTDLPSTSATTTTTTTDDPLPTSTSTPTTTGTPDPPTASTSGTGETTTPFISKPDASDDPTGKCDGLKQLNPECPPGQKCTIDGALTASHCVDIVPRPKGLYEPCTVQRDQFSGLDDCDLGMLCWDVDKQGHGTCIGLCDWEGIECTCADPKAARWFCQDCAVGLCFPTCDPLIQDCPDDKLCIASMNGSNTFTCTPDASGDEGQTNDPCESINGCDEGLLCLIPAFASSACMPDAFGCCQPFCDFSKNASCPNPDQECRQYFDPMNEIPEGLEDVGVCAIPA